MPETIYSLEQINDWQSKLAVLAEKPRTRFSKKQAVEAMIEQIELALESHPYDEVASSLKQWGLDIAAGSLKQYVNAYRREHLSEVSASARKGSGGKGKKNSKAKASGGRSHSADSRATENQTPGAESSSKSGSQKVIGKSRRPLPESDLDIEKEFNL